MNNYLLSFIFGVCAIFISNNANAQEQTKKCRKTGSLYFSWGYNTEWYTRSNVHVKQHELGNDYDLVQVHARDKKGWDKHFLKQQLTIPQYNYRLGYFFNERQDMGIEINFDHTKYVIVEPQNVRVKGTLDGKATDMSILFLKSNGFYYYLNNGANFFLINFVKRFELYRTKGNSLRVDLLGKAGVGPLVPHVENSFFGKANDPHFQVGGWNTGIETALRVTVMRYGYLEFAQKVDYARYSHLRIYAGTARQNFGTYELILSAGVTLPTTKHNPMFKKM